MEVQPRIIKKFETIDGSCPFDDWFESLDLKTKMIIDARLLRLRTGNFGKCESVGGDIKELKVYFGPGYRIYFAELNWEIVHLLCGGDKNSQQKDIKRAQEFWKEYMR